MASLIACLTSDSGAWAHVKRIIENQEWDNIFIVGTDESCSSFQCSKQADRICVDTTRLLPELSKDIFRNLNGKIDDFEVAVNFVSGSGKEHMALMSAVLKLGLGVRLVALTKEGIREL